MASWRNFARSQLLSIGNSSVFFLGNQSLIFRMPQTMNNTAKKDN